MNEICSKLKMKTPERCPWRRSGVSTVNVEQTSHVVLVFLIKFYIHAKIYPLGQP